MIIIIALGKVFFVGGVLTKIIDTFLILPLKVCCGYLLKSPHQGNSNEYPQYIFCFLFFFFVEK